ncbi:MAG: glycosyltransferase family 4 protein [Burkholderiales bacterium]|nr:glycosyltransferase family 4 protein [Burkholderiales bacterium]
MRVGIVSPEFPPDVGGVETYACEFACELARRGHEVTVFTIRHPAGEANLPGIEVRPVLAQRRNLDREVLRAHRADIWHAMNAGYAWLALEGLPTVVSVHGNDFLWPRVPMAQIGLQGMTLLWRFADLDPRWLQPLWAWRTRRLMARAMPRARRIVANSRYTEAEFLRRHPACAGRTTVAYVGVAGKFFEVQRERAPAGAPRRLLTVCRLSEPRKNVDVVLRALAGLAGEFDFEYTVIGDGHRRGELEALARSLGLAGRVRFLGRVDDAALMRAYGQADLFVLTASVLPGSHEGFGIVYLEAAASGLPSLAARQAGAAEAVAEGVSGMFVEQPDVDSVGAALRRFLASPEEFDEAACRRFAAGFRWPRIVDAVLPWYGPT